eukprot:2459169-Amphidinium_carterae.1
MSRTVRVSFCCALQATHPRPHQGRSCCVGLRPGHPGDTHHTGSCSRIKQAGSAYLSKYAHTVALGGELVSMQP